MDKIHQVKINKKNYNINESIIKKFDYFEPFLEKRFHGGLKVKFDFCNNENLIKAFVELLYDNVNLLSLKETFIIRNMFKYLLCNDCRLYKKIINNPIPNDFISPKPIPSQRKQYSKLPIINILKFIEFHINDYIIDYQEF